MHICFAGPISLDLINHPFEQDKIPGGYPFPFNSQFVNALLKKGHKISVVTYSTGIENPIILKSENLSFYIAKRREKKAARDFFNYEVKQMVDFFNNINCDIVISNWTYEISLAAIKSNQKKITIRLQDYPPLIIKLNPSPYQFIRMLIHYYVSNKAPFLNANSEYLFNLLPKRLKNKTVIIPNYLSDEIFNRNFQKKQNYIITVSHGFKGRKNISQAILAFNKILKIFPNLEYYLVGSQLGENEDAHQFAKKYGIETNIRFLGLKSYSETLDLIAKAKIMLHPSLEESFGMSVLEAMALGTPVVGGIKSGNIPFLLDNGKCGGLCDVTDPEKIYDKVIEFLKNEKKLEEISFSAKDFALNNFSETVVINQFEKYFESIIYD